MTGKVKRVTAKQMAAWAGVSVRQIYRWKKRGGFPAEASEETLRKWMNTQADIRVATPARREEEEEEAEEEAEMDAMAAPDQAWELNQLRIEKTRKEIAKLDTQIGDGKLKIAEKLIEEIAETWVELFAGIREVVEECHIPTSEKHRINGFLDTFANRLQNLSAPENL